MIRTIALADEQATQRLGAAVARALRAGDAVCLYGPLGAGKTTLARGLVRALTTADEDVPSPTFTLVQTYDTPKLSVSHFDLYRLKNPAEMDELGLDEALETGAALIEWPERAEKRLPADRLMVDLQANADGRKAFLSGPVRWREVFGA